jgi:phage-related holin
MKFRKLNGRMLLVLLLITEIMMTSIGIISHTSTKEISFMIVYIGVVWMIFSFVSISMDIVLSEW